MTSHGSLARDIKEGIAQTVDDQPVLVSLHGLGDVGVVADYQIGQNRFVAFLSKRETPHEAKTLARGYRDFLITYGGTSISQVSENPHLEIVEILGAHEFIFSQGTFFAGVHEASDKQSGMGLANRLQQRLKEID